MKINEVTKLKESDDRVFGVSAEMSKDGKVFGKIEVSGMQSSRDILNHPAVLKSKSGKVYVPVTYSADLDMDNIDVGTDVEGRDPDFGKVVPTIEGFSLEITKVVFDVYPSDNLDDIDPTEEKVLHDEKIPDSVVQFINSRTSEMLHDDSFHDAIIAFVKDSTSEY